MLHRKRCNNTQTHVTHGAFVVQRRRFDDIAQGIIVATLGRSQAGLAAEVAAKPPGGVAIAAPQAAIPGFAPMVLIDAGQDGLLCVYGGEVRRVPAHNDGAHPDMATLETDWVKRVWAMEKRKRQFGDGFVVFVEHANRLTTSAQVYEALLQHTPALIGGYAAVLMLPASSSDGNLWPLTDRRIEVPLGHIVCNDGLQAHGPTLVTPADVAAGFPLAGLAPLFTDIGATHLACVSLGREGLLLVVERRSEREFSGEDWFRLQAMARHAERVLERIRLAEQLHKVPRPRRRRPNPPPH